MQVAQGDLAGALKSYRDSLAISTGWRNPIPATPAGNAISRCRTTRIGNVQVAQGDLAGALTSYREASRSSTGWRDPIPATPDGSAISRCRIGRSRRAQGKGDRREALEALQSGHAIMVRLTALSPDNANGSATLTGSRRRSPNSRNRQRLPRAVCGRALSPFEREARPNGLVRATNGRAKGGLTPFAASNSE